MKKFTRLLLLLWLTIAFGNAYAQTVLSTESFPGTFNTGYNTNVNTSCTGSTGSWGCYSNCAHGSISVNNTNCQSAPYCLRLINKPNYCGSTSHCIATSPNVNCTTKCVSSVTLCFKLLLYSISQSNSNFTFYVEVSKDNGSTWTSVYTQTASQLYGTCGGTNTWKNICVSIPASFYSSVFKYRFRTTQSSYCGYTSHVCIDDVCVTTTPCNNLVLGNLIWLDSNGNNTKDASEPGIPNATVKLYADANNDDVADGAAVATTTTNSSGNYTFTGLAAGNYIAGVIIPAGYTKGAATTTDPDNNVDNDNNGVNLIGANQGGGEVRAKAITLLQYAEPTTDGDDANGNLTDDIALCPAPNNLVLGNLVWLDINANNLKDATEPVIPGATVKLYKDANNDNIADGAAVATTTTNASGLYTFTGLAAGNYIVGVTIPAGYQARLNGAIDPDNNIDNDNNGVTLVGANAPGSELRSNAITLLQTTEPTTDGDDANGNLTLDLAMCPIPNNLVLGNLVWLDSNGNNTKEASEPAVPNATVKLYLDANNDNVADGAAIATTTTNASGNYSFTGLTANNYIVGVIIPTGYTRGPITTVDPDTDIDNDNNGVTLIGANQPGSEVRSLAITLLQFSEPTTDGDDNNGNQTLDIALCPAASNLSLGTTVWLDINGNQFKDATEPVVPNAVVKLYLDANNDNVADGAAIATTATNNNGVYSFTGLAAGNYIAGVIIPPNYQARLNGNIDPDNDIDNDNNGVTLVTVNLPGNEVRSNAVTLLQFTEPTNDGDDNNGNGTVDFGLCPIVNNIVLGNLVWADINGNNVRDASEPAVSNATVYLYLDANNDNIADGVAIASTTTNAAGNYSFTGLSANNYIAGVVIPAGYIKGPASSADPDNDVDNDNNGVNLIGANQAGGEVRSLAITLLQFSEPTTDGDDNSGNQTLDIALSVAPSLKLGNFVWNDYDGDGKKDLNEPGIPNAPVSLYRDDNGDNLPDTELPIATVNTSATGFYLFNNLVPGRYIVSMPILPGYQQSPNTSTQATSPNPDTDVDNDNNLVRLVGPNGPGGIEYSNAITLVANGEPTTDGDDANGNLTMDLALCGNSFIGDFVWNDLNGNGIQDAGEPGINGATVTILLNDGVTTATTTTLTYNGTDGYYDFKNLGPGTYNITFTTPSGLTPVPANQGGDDTKDSDPVNGGPVTVTLAANQSDFTIDAGFRAPAILSLGNLVYIDLNGNGTRESTEPGVPGATVNLYRDTNGDNAADGAAIATTATAVDGTYMFNNLSADSYIVGVAVPTGYGFLSVYNPLPNNDIDNDNNAVRLVGNEARTNFITLVPGTEPTNDGDNNNTNSTLDLALILTNCSCRLVNGSFVSLLKPATSLFDNADVKTDVKVYPNPAVNNFTIKLNSEKQGVAMVWITDMHGRTVAARNLSVNPGTNLVQMNADSKMPSGVYTIQSIVDGKVISKRLVIAR